MLFETNFADMSDADITFTVMRLDAMHQATGEESYKRLADAADEVRAARIMAAIAKPDGEKPDVEIRSEAA